MTTALLVAPARLLLIVLLPFVVLVRGAVWLDQRHQLPAWLALVGAGLATLTLLTVYGAWIARRLTGRARWRPVATWIVAPLVMSYCAYGVFYLSRANVKSDTVRSSYHDTHPVLRIALSTLTLADPNAVVTDLARHPSDYPAMGLPVNPRSRHYAQGDGWVHAVDLRTAGRPAASWAMERYFRLMGFATLRHTGTADHLHVELP
ncbi:MAG TPA: hypothetical protein VD793_01260 [Gemmatimonadales bacterium]|nr:hypothetical protein [Gemmatimonadales bacterium]